MHGLIELLVAWWKLDRPRVSPRVGRLLRIRPPAIIVAESCVAEVLRRRVIERDTGPSVVYDCMSGGNACKLWVAPSFGEHATMVCWCANGRETFLSEDDIEVFARC